MNDYGMLVTRRASAPGFATHYFVGQGLDVARGSDRLREFARLFPQVRSLAEADLSDNAQALAHYPDDHFDFLNSSLGLEQLPHPAETLKQWMRVVKPGGYLVVLVPDEDLYDRGRRHGSFNGEYKHTFTLFKSASWSPVSINLTDLFAAVADRSEVVKVEQLYPAFAARLGGDEPPPASVAACAIEFILRKRTSPLASSLEAARTVGWTAFPRVPLLESGRPAPPNETAADKEKAAQQKTHTSRARQLHKESKYKEAEAEFRRALALDPADAGLYCDLGVTLIKLKRLAEAEAAFQLAVRFDPLGATGYFNLVNACLDRGRPVDAEQWVRQLVLLKPESAEAHRLLGKALDARGHGKDAEEAFREALRLKADLAEAHFGLADVLAKTKRFADAEASYRKATKLRPQHAPSWRGLARALEELGRLPEAESTCREAIRLGPNSWDAHNNLGVILAALDRPAEAEACYREALRLRPGFSVAQSNLGNALRALGRMSESEAILRESLRSQPKSAEAHNNLGIALVQQGRIEEGLQLYDEAIRLRSDYPEARLNRALSLLLTGDFARGWPDYEWRFKMRHVKAQKFEVPQWDGSPLDGKSILLQSEQGLGDTIQFIRYAPLVKQRGGTVVVDSPEVLAAIIATCPGVDQVVPRGQALPRFETYVPMMSLPGLLGMPPEAGTAVAPYFTPPPDRVEYWRNELADVKGYRVGIAWQGSKSHRGDRIRSVPLAQFAGLAEVPGVQLLSLQKGAGSEQLDDGSAIAGKVIDLGKRTRAGIEDAAAVLVNLNLLICVDTALGHLAGALGVPVWVAVPSAPDWRWMRHREDTIWYDSMRLFRQLKIGDWVEVFDRLQTALREAVPAHAVEP